MAGMCDWCLGTSEGGSNGQQLHMPQYVALPDNDCTKLLIVGAY